MGNSEKEIKVRVWNNKDGTISLQVTMTRFDPSIVTAATSDVQARTRSALMRELSVRINRAVIDSYIGKDPK